MAALELAMLTRPHGFWTASWPCEHRLRSIPRAAHCCLTSSPPQAGAGRAAHCLGWSSSLRAAMATHGRVVSSPCTLLDSFIFFLFSIPKRLRFGLALWCQNGAVPLKAESFGAKLTVSLMVGVNFLNL
ncbi:hypothetical protein ACOSQ3_028927 [Xanthoceras sorbifolium]